MKKLLAILALVTIFVTANSEVTRTGLIRTGGNIMNKMTFTTADSCVTSDTFSITITNIQSYYQHVTATYTMDSLSGDPSMGVTLYGKTTSTGSWTSIGTATWDDVADNPQSITTTTAGHYNWLKLEFIASATTQESKILTLDVRTANQINLPAASGTLTISRPTEGTVTITSADNNANAALTIGAGGTGALTLGDAGSTTAITSSDWAIGTTGIATGLGAITSDGLITGTLGATISGATTSINASSNFATNINTGTSSGALSLGGGSGTVAINSSDWDISTTGVMTNMGAATFDGVITATGGIATPNASPVIWAKGGSTVLATSGTDVACANGTRFWVEVDIPYNVTLTGIAYLVGSVGGTDSVVVQLVNSAGTEVATSRPVGTAADLVGTAAQFQSVAFSETYAAVAGKYYAVVQFNGTTAKFRAYPIPGSKFITGSVSGTWGTAAGITPGTTFTADKGPILMTY